MLGRRPSYALVKGRHHYLCLAGGSQAAPKEEPGGLFDDGPQWLAARPGASASR